MQSRGSSLTLLNLGLKAHPTALPPVGSHHRYLPPRFIENIGTGSGDDPNELSVRRRAGENRTMSERTRSFALGWSSLLKGETSWWWLGRTSLPPPGVRQISVQPP